MTESGARANSSAPDCPTPAPLLRSRTGRDPPAGRRIRRGASEDRRPAAPFGRGVDDPHVARLLEGVAFLAARVHHRLDDEFPELTDALLGLLYPHYLAPVPSCMVAQFDCAAGPDGRRHACRRAWRSIPSRCAASLALPHHRAGDAVAGRGGECPADRAADRRAGQPARRRRRRGAAHHAEMRLRRTSASPSWASTGCASSCAGRQQPLPLYELLGGHALSVAFADAADRSQPGHRAGRRRRAGRLRAEEALLPWSARGFAGFRLLTEYFAFPEKFLFIDFSRHGQEDPGVRRQPAGDLHLSRPRRAGTGTHGRPSSRWRWAARRWSICSRSAASRSRSTHTAHRIPRRAGCPPADRAEVWSVERVRETLARRHARPWRPFHRLTAARSGSGVPGGFYHVDPARRAHPACPGPRCSSRRTTRTSIPTHPATRCCRSTRCASIATCRPTCPSAAAVRRLRLVEGAAAVSAVTAVTAPRTTLRPPLREHGVLAADLASVTRPSVGHRWRPGARPALKEVLRLYDVARHGRKPAPAIDALMAIDARARHRARAWAAPGGVLPRP